MPAKKTHNSSLKKPPQNKHQWINPKHTDYEKGGEALADVILKELVSMLVKARCEAQQMGGGRGGPIHGADLKRSWHAVWPKDAQWSLVLLAQRTLKTGPGSWSFCEISGLPNEGGGDNLDGLQSKAIARTEGLEKSSKPFWVFEECNGRMTQTYLVWLAVFVGAC